MREIRLKPILLFSGFVLFILAGGIGSTIVFLRPLPLGDYRPIVTVAASIAAIYVVAIALYRVFLSVRPVEEGIVEEGSPEEFNYHVYLLFYLVFFYSLTRSKFLPVPLMRLIYQGLGARLGKNTYSSGTILDPPLTSMGDHCIVGQDAVLYSHAIEGRHLSHAAIVLGNHVTIGANAVVMSGARIGDHAVVASGAVVLKDARIPAREIWGGVPARKIGEVPAVSPEPALEATPSSAVPRPAVPLSGRSARAPWQPG